MKKLLEGVHEFQAQAYKARKDLFSELAGGQKPRVLFITCSDSRIAPHLITGSEPGDIFVIRNAGNLIPPRAATFAGGEEATVEYAVAALNVKHIVVCGHSDCGAMKGLLNPESLTGVPSVASWLQWARPARDVVDATFPEVSPDERLMRTIETNVLGQLESLRTHPSVAVALAQGAVSLHAWVYHIGSGEITAYDEGKGKFAVVENNPTPVTGSLSLAAS